jgi:hypothetical protein
MPVLPAFSSLVKDERVPEPYNAGSLPYGDPALGGPVEETGEGYSGSGSGESAGSGFSYDSEMDQDKWVADWPRVSVKVELKSAVPDSEKMKVDGIITPKVGQSFSRSNRLLMSLDDYALPAGDFSCLCLEDALTLL